MKFEKPIAEIERFTLQDVISASDETTEHVFNPETGTVYAELGYECTGRQEDNYNFDNCL